MTGSTDDNMTVKGEAVDWFVRLQSAGDDDWRAFELWLSGDPARALAFEAVERLWVDLDLARGDFDTQAPTAQVIPFRRRKPGTMRWGVWVATGGMAAMLVAAIAISYPRRPIGAHTDQILATAKGQRKTLFLADGTRVNLDSATKITVRFDRTARNIRLWSGEAAFAVAHRSARPLIVTVADRRITDIGTVFDVLTLDDTLKVTVAQGEVVVAPAPLSLGHPATVTAGLQLVHHVGAPESTIRPVNAEASMAWRSGRLVYQDAPLPAVALDLNRYFQTPIRVKVDGAAKLRFSGVLVLDSEDAVVRRLQVFLPVAVERTSDAIWISARPRP